MKHYLLLFFSFTLTILTAQQDTTLPYSVAEQMPYVYTPQGDSLETYDEKRTLGEKRMMTIIHRNLKYPKLGSCIEGFCVVRFTVFKNGTIGDYKLLKDIGAGAGEEALKAVRFLENEIWIPAYQDGKSVDVFYNVPVRFKL